MEFVEDLCIKFDSIVEITTNNDQQINDRQESHKISSELEEESGKNERVVDSPVTQTGLAEQSPVKTTSKPFAGFTLRGSCYLGKNNLEMVKSKFKAGGVLFHRHHPTSGRFQLLMGLEYRSRDKLHLHPIGGRRNSNEDPLMTAAREFCEETGKLLSQTKVMQAIDPTQRVNTSNIHRSKCIYLSNGKYCLYIARCPEAFESIDDRYNSSNQGDMEASAELAGLIWIDWLFLEDFFSKFSRDDKPVRKELYPVDEVHRTTFVNSVTSDLRDAARDAHVVLTSFVLEVLGNSIVYKELSSRSAQVS